MRRGSLLWFNMRIFLSSGGFWSHWGWFGVFLGLLEATPLNPKASPSRAAAPPPRPRRELQTLSFYELTRHFLADEDEMQNILHHELSKAHRLPADGVFTANYSDFFKTKHQTEETNESILACAAKVEHGVPPFIEDCPPPCAIDTWERC